MTEEATTIPPEQTAKKPTLKQRREDVQYELLLLEEQDPAIISSCGLCNYKLFDLLMSVAVKTEAKPRMVCDEFSKLYNEDRDERDHVTGKAFYERYRKVNKDNLEELDQNRPTKPKKSEAQTFSQDIPESKDGNSLVFLDIPMFNPTTSHSGAVDIHSNSTEHYSKLTQFAVGTTNNLRLKGYSEHDVIYFFKAGFENTSGHYCFRMKNPYIAIKRIVQKEKTPASQLAQIISDGIKACEDYRYDEYIYQLIQHLQEASSNKASS